MRLLNAAATWGEVVVLSLRGASHSRTYASMYRRSGSVLSRDSTKFVRGWSPLQRVRLFCWSAKVYWSKRMPPVSQWLACVLDEHKAGPVCAATQFIMADNIIKVGVIGVGYLGKFHAEKYAASPR